MSGSVSGGGAGGMSDRPIESVGAPAVATIDRGAARPPRWVPTAATTIGSVHVRDGLPLQDAVLTWADADRTVIAVADGHGHHAHFRSDVGASLAVATAVEEVRRALGELTDVELAADMVRRACAAIVSSWTARVREHIAGHPFTDEQRAAGADTDPLRPYGSTLLVLAVSGDVLVVAQIGDGDAVLVDSRGEAFRPLPDDPFHDGVHTNSLCQTDPMASLHLAVYDTAVEDISLGFLCTYGFGKSRASGDWWQQTGQQLWQYSREHGLGWVSEHLPGWLAEPARVGGDDTTLALVVRNQ